MPVRAPQIFIRCAARMWRPRHDTRTNARQTCNDDLNNTDQSIDTA